MSDKVLVMSQKALTFILIVAGVFIFIMSLGFMTNLHVLLFDGTNEMYDYYKSVQVLNKSMFSIAILYIIYAFMLIPFDINKGKVGIFGLLLVLIATVITILKSLTMFKYIPYFQGIYNAFDFSVIEDYVASPWIFNLSNSMFLVWDIIAGLLLIVVSINFVRAMKATKLLRGVTYES